MKKQSYKNIYSLTNESVAMRRPSLGAPPTPYYQSSTPKWVRLFIILFEMHQSTYGSGMMCEL